MTEEKKHIIKVYSTKTCPYCVSLKAYLDEKGIKYEALDVGEDKEAAKYMIGRSGQMGVPVTEIDDEIVIGFDKPRINELLEIKE